MSLSTNQFLMLYTWFLVTALLILTLLIARFYQRFSGTRGFYAWFLVPVLLFGVAAIRYTSVGSMSGDALADVLSALGGTVLMMLCFMMYRLMLYKRGKPDGGN
jgi:hypothetical protein